MKQTLLGKCSCQNEFQDSKYGKQIRVMNLTKKRFTQDKGYYRCTVCTREHVL